MGNTSRFSDAGYDLWIADYNDNPNNLTRLFGKWKIYAFHQYRGDFHSASFTPDVDYFTADCKFMEYTPPLSKGRVPDRAGGVVYFT